MKNQLASLKMLNATLTLSLQALQSQLNTTQQTMSAAQQRSEDLQVSIKKDIKEGHLLKQFLQTSMASKEEALQVMQIPHFYTSATTGLCCSISADFWSHRVHLDPANGSQYCTQYAISPCLAESQLVAHQ